MKLLVVGSGGREHALVWKLKQSPRVEKIYCAPGNGGISAIADCAPIAADDVEALADFAQTEKIDLTIVGPERPLTLGLVDRFAERGLAAFGPSKAAAELEGSKIFAKQFMQRHAIPTAGFEVYDAYAEAVNHVNESHIDFPLVIKADGLAAGKGVIMASTPAEAQTALRQMMGEKIFGEAGRRVVIEECLTGEETSFMVFSDGEFVQPLAAARDYKRIYDDDQGPNTGGMGAFSDDDLLSRATRKLILDRIVYPTIHGMAAEGRPYKGVLYVGLMLTSAGPKVLEFNARLGDPETQVVLPRLESDLLPVLEAVTNETLFKTELQWSRKAALSVVLASAGYPGPYEKDRLVTGVDMAEEEDNVVVFHSGTRRESDRYYTNGGRVLAVTALGNDLSAAIIKSYEAVNKIHFDGMHCRRDIGARGLRRIRMPDSIHD
ncbi:MAG: phosphoribosylamine--glycine ligase [Acidobacteria bacterium]|nr:phosphoribosylamine--glycine ligase [Acidobacteriota bacterium]MBI3656100.1 phosphoribosylamine--glycine ligase [Acidobacteriota bacterium]